MPTKNKKSKKSKLASFKVANRLRFVNFVLVFALVGVSLLVFSMAAPIPGEYGSVEKDQIARINNARGPDLAHIECLRQVARDWTVKMVNAGKISHNPNIAAQVSSKCGGYWTIIGENVGVGYSSSGLFNAFMASPSHKANIVDSRFTRAGVGAYWSASGRLFVTQVFANCSNCSGGWNTAAKPPADPVAPAKWSGWETFGDGTITGDPDVASWGTGRLDVFARGSDNTLRHKAYRSGGWSSWTNKGGRIYSDPTAVSWGSGRIDVFARSSANTLLHTRYLEGTGWSAWQDLGGNFVSSPTVASWGSGRLDVFARNSSNKLVHRAYASATGWSKWQTLDGNFVGDPSAVSWGSNRIDIVARNSSNQLVHKWWTNTGSWSGWENLGGSFVSDPAISARTTGILDIFARNSSNKLVHKNFSAYGWSQWYTLDGSFVSGPTSESWASDRIDVFARNSSNQLVHKWLSR